MTLTLIPENKLDELRSLAKAYYGTRHGIERQYLDHIIDPATYTTDGVLDKAGYLAGLTELLQWAESPEAKAVVDTPTSLEPYQVWEVEMFASYAFEARRRISITTKKTYG